MDIFPEDLRSFPRTSPTYLERNSLIAYHSKKILGLNVSNKFKKTIINL